MASGSRLAIIDALIGEVLTMHMGPDFILANISVDFKDTIEAQQLESDVADHAIKQKFPQIKRVFVEAEKRGNKYPHGS